MYSPQLMDHFEHPRNAGQVENADAVVKVENPVCGDVLELSLRVADGHIGEIQFRAKGCVPTMGCGSAVTELAKGKSVGEARTIGKDDVTRAVGGLPAASSHAAQLAVDALRTALGKLS
jgi:nitrogen fixation protein NifU and related proteins